MPQVTVVPQAQVIASNPNEAFSTTSSLIQLLQHKKSIDLENQLLEQQLSLRQQLDPLEVQVKQVQLHNEQAAGKLEELIGPMKERLLGAQATSAEEETAALPGKLQDEAKQRTMAQALVSQQLDNAKLSGQITTQQYEEQKRLFPLHVEETKGKIAETVQNVIQSRAYTEYLKVHASKISDGKNDEQASQIINTWDGIDPHARQMIKESPDFKDNPVIQALPTTGKMRKSDIMQMFNDKIQEVWDDPNSTPAARAGANQMMGTMLQLQSGTYKTEEQADAQAGIMGLKRQSLQDKIGSFLQLSTKKNGAASTQPSGNSVETTSVPQTQDIKTGIDEVDRTLYHASQNQKASDIKVGDVNNTSIVAGASRRAVNKFLAGRPTDTASNGYTFGFKEKKGNQYSTLTRLYETKRLGGQGEEDDLPTVQKALVVDPNATLRQQSVYESLIKATSFNDYNGKGIQQLIDATHKLASAAKTGPDGKIVDDPANPLTIMQLQKINSLIDYFGEDK